MRGMHEDNITERLIFGRVGALAPEERLKVELHAFNLSTRTASRLRRAGIDTLGALCDCGEVDLLKLPGFGRKCLREVHLLLALCGLRLRISSSVVLDPSIRSLDDWRRQERSKSKTRKARLARQRAEAREGHALRMRDARMRIALEGIRTYLDRGYITMQEVDVTNLRRIVEAGLRGVE